MWERLLSHTLLSPVIQLLYFSSNLLDGNGILFYLPSSMTPEVEYLFIYWLFPFLCLWIACSYPLPFCLYLFLWFVAALCILDINFFKCFQMLQMFSPIVQAYLIVLCFAFLLCTGVVVFTNVRSFSSKKIATHFIAILILLRESGT